MHEKSFLAVHMLVKSLLHRRMRAKISTLLEVATFALEGAEICEEEKIPHLARFFSVVSVAKARGDVIARNRRRVAIRSTVLLLRKDADTYD